MAEEAIVGVKTRKYVRTRDEYDPTKFDQDAVDPSEIPKGTPKRCAHCNDKLTPLRRLQPWINGPDGKPLLFCTKNDCLLSRRQAKTANWRLANLHKQGETLVIVQPGEVTTTSKRGTL